jgi:hypothetical protein
MSENLVNLYTTQYSTRLDLKLQQLTSKLRGRTEEGYHVGKLASPVQQMNAIAAKAPAGRFAPLNRTDTDFTRRWVAPTDRDINQLIDSFDELKTIVDPKSRYVENAAAAFSRAWDDAIIASVTASASIGVDIAGLSTETFDTSTYQISDTFGASATVGMTVAKLIELKRLLRHYHATDMEEQVTVVMGSQQESDLLQQVQVVSTEFNDKPVLVDGKITRFLGMDIVFSERLAYASSKRTCFAFVRSGLYLGIWRDVNNKISQRTDLSSQPWQIYTNATFGATRTQPGKVWTILAADTSGADITP